MNLSTLIYTKFFGHLVGVDQFGNKYYQNPSLFPSGRRMRRWVCYNGIAEPSKVPPLWHSWLHHQAHDIPGNSKKYKWEKEIIPNLTGTEYAYYPNGHVLSDGHRAKVSGDYEVWKPKQN